MRASRVHYLQVHPGLPEPELSIVEPFRVIVVAEIEVPNDWKYKISCWLLDTGCLYAVCWGIDCAGWEQQIDDASITYDQRNKTSGDHFLLTTSHAEETLADALWFAENCAFEEFLSLDYVLILHISIHDAESFMRSKYEASKTFE